MMIRYKITSIWLLLLLLLATCKTKEKTVDKDKESKDLLLKEKTDSATEVHTDRKLNYFSGLQSKSSSFFLQSVTSYDSLGNQKPFHYKHYIDGKLQEEIWLEGGEISNSADSKKETKSGQVEEEIKTQKAFSLDKKQESRYEVNAVKKTKNVEVKGFQAGFYISWIIIVIVLLLVWWLYRKFKD